jgi:ferrochelatase
MKGILLVNLGTPDDPTSESVGNYLKAEAYRKIWTPEGSPLLVESRKLAARLGGAMEDEYMVELAMTYGQPDIRSGLENLRAAGAEKLLVVPLYPQYSGTTTEAVFDVVSAALRDLDWFPQLKSVQKYHDAPGWAEAVAASVRRFQETMGQPEKLLFSLHGIPQRYVDNGDPYAAQCRQSVEDVVDLLGLQDEDWMLTFQSRVGREPWLQPYTDITLKELATQGVRNVQVVCPGFAVDCLETLEEIAMQNAELFIESGGERLDYIPALNDSQDHVDMLARLVRDQFPV